MKEDAIRNCIFRKEFYCVFKESEVFETEKLAEEIGNIIFENYSLPQSQLILKKPFTTIQVLESELKKISIPPDLIESLKNLFVFYDDLIMPKEIRQLFSNNEGVAIFVGAGVSRLAGLLSWEDLANASIKFSFEEGKINYLEYEGIIRKVKNPREKLTIFHEFFPKLNERAKFFYREIFSQRKVDENPYNILARLDCLKVTTNIDNMFFEAIEKFQVDDEGFRGVQSEATIFKRNEPKKYYKEFDGITQINTETLYQIHGSIDELETTIITTKDYIDRYYRENIKFREFLSNIFNQFTVIFVGYGLTELEIIANCSASCKTHYSLFPTFIGEAGVERKRMEYFKNLNITPLFYYVDFNGYERLNQVIKSWLQEIQSAKKGNYYQAIREIDEAINA